MKAYGHELSKYDTDDDVLIELGEVSFQGTAEELREYGQFLIECAEFMERGSTQDHWHFNGNVDERPQLVVCQPPVNET